MHRSVIFGIVTTLSIRYATFFPPCSKRAFHKFLQLQWTAGTIGLPLWIIILDRAYLGIASDDMLSHFDRIAA